MNCQEFRAMKGTAGPDTTASTLVAAWNHFQSCGECKAIANEVWTQETQERRELVSAVAPLLAARLAMRVANDPELADQVKTE